MPLSQNTALFSVIGIQFGGNGTTTFGLPNLQGRMPIGMGQGPGLPDYSIGEASGERSAMNMISPMTELAGVMCGDSTSSGSSSVTVWSRS